MTAFNIRSGDNIGTAGNDIFYLNAPVGDFTLDGNGGYDVFEANVAFLEDPYWEYNSIDELRLSGSTKESLYLSAATPYIDATHVSSYLIIEPLETDMTVYGGAATQIFTNSLSSNYYAYGDFNSALFYYSEQPGGSILGRNYYHNISDFGSGNSNDTVYGSDGDNFVYLLGGSNYFDGRGGQDTYWVAGQRADFTVTKSASDFIVSSTSDPSSETTHLVNVERLQFEPEGDGLNSTLALDINGNAGQVYRLYQAAFDRTPDTVGLASNVGLVDDGMNLYDMANAFAQSAEFLSTYGTTTNEQYVNTLYNNVLGRDADPAGLAGWLDTLESGHDRGFVLVGFSESPENIALVAPAIDNGIWLG